MCASRHEIHLRCHGIPDFYALTVPPYIVGLCTRIQYQHIEGTNDYQNAIATAVYTERMNSPSRGRKSKHTFWSIILAINLCRNDATCLHEPTAWSITEWRYDKNGNDGEHIV
jgi:hypothetical protein